MFESPFTAIISEASGTGKTEWIKKLLKNKDAMIKESERFEPNITREVFSISEV